MLTQLWIIIGNGCSPPERRERTQYRAQAASDPALLSIILSDGRSQLCLGRDTVSQLGFWNPSGSNYFMSPVLAKPKFFFLFKYLSAFLLKHHYLQLLIFILDIFYMTFIFLMFYNYYAPKPIPPSEYTFHQWPQVLFHLHPLAPKGQMLYFGCLSLDFLFAKFLILWFWYLAIQLL